MPPPLANCVQCPRLATHLVQIRQQYPEYHARPVPNWGRKSSRLLVVGLAPGLHGANRTGRPFTGDSSGNALFAALAAAGLVTVDTNQNGAKNQVQLENIRITNVVKCLPPANAPTASELNNCRDYLQTELAELWQPSMRRPRVILALGGKAYDSIVRALRHRVPASQTLQPFRHGGCEQVAPQLWLLATYHPSRLNMNTGRLSAQALSAVCQQAANLLDG